MTVVAATAFGSPAAIVAAVGVVFLAVVGFGRGSVAMFGFQRSKIEGLLDEVADLKRDAESKDARIVELERIVAATQLLPVAGFQPILDAFAAHELRAAARHVELQAEHKRLIEMADGQLRILGDLAAHLPEGTTP